MKEDKEKEVEKEKIRKMKKKLVTWKSKEWYHNEMTHSISSTRSPVNKRRLTMDTKCKNL